ncbi:MAG: hypothetical protein GXO92_02680 [FCB group bacterium]|nr:hypothetical protein [FCB group bacterium]
MAKKNRNESKKAQRKENLKNKKKARTRNISIGMVLILIVTAGFIMSANGDADLPEARGGEKRPTLAPRLFPGNVARAYEVAREIPEILDKIYCYCECQENIGHKSLLTCFVDRHGSRCGICLNEALIAYDLYKKGDPVEDIVKKVQSTMASGSRG